MPHVYYEKDVQEKLREAAGWKGSAKFAQKIGVSPGYLSQVMNGKRGANETILNSIGLRTAIISLPQKTTCRGKKDGA